MKAIHYLEKKVVDGSGPRTSSSVKWVHLETTLKMGFFMEMLSYVA